MKRLILILIFILISSGQLLAEELNPDEIYKDSFRPDIPRSMQDIPFEDSEYYGKHKSPYALVRFAKKCKYDKDVMSPGFYLVKPFSENSVDYLIFKKNNVAVALVPVINKDDLPKKAKKMKISLIEDNHGKEYIVTIKYKLNSYSVKLDILED